MPAGSRGPVQPAARPYPLAAVTLGPESVFTPARDRMLHLARVYPVDRLLAVFRANAGLDTLGAEPPGSWEGFGHPGEEPWGEHDYPGRERAQTANLLRGHYAGHFLSMLSLAYAGTGEEPLREKIDALVAGLGEVQGALAATGRYSHPGFLAAYGEWQFSRLESYAPYGEIWAPYYTTHKIMAGLLDAFEAVGSRQALSMVSAMGRWVHGRLTRLEPERIQRMWSLYIAGEFGGMNETLARLAAATGEPEFLRTARFFDQENVIEAGAVGTDILEGMHANQHVPQLIGYVREYEITGDARYLDAAVGVFGDVVPGRMFAHGGTGENELWGPPNTVAGEIGARNAETCVVYNLLKLARSLFGHTLDPTYMDYYERGVLNQVLGSRRAVDSDSGPEVTYMFPVHPGARREFGNVGTCCGGTGLENHVKHQDTVFFHATGQLWINQFFPTVLDRGATGEGVLNVRVDGGYPLGTGVRVRFEAGEGATETTAETLAVHLRVPAWVSGPVVVTVNGGQREAGEEPRPGEYLTLEREWNDGDEIEISLPTALRSVPTVDDASVHSVELGPIVLLARSEETARPRLPLVGNRRLNGSLYTEETVEDLLEQLRTSGTLSYAGLEWEPAFSGGHAPYHMYVEQADAVIAFAGRNSRVPNRMRPTGTTVLDSIWERGPFDTRQEFLARTANVVSRSRGEGVLSRTEAEKVLKAAADAEIEGPRDGSASPTPSTSSPRGRGTNHD